MSTTLEVPRIAVIVLHWGEVDTTLCALSSLGRLQRTPDRVFVVDQMGDFPEQNDGAVEVLRPSTNLGYAGGNNIALERVAADGYEYALLFNNDAVAGDGLLSVLGDALTQRPHAAAAGPTVLELAPPNRVHYGGGLLDLRHGQTSHLHKGEPTLPHTSDAETTTFITGCSLMLRMSVVRQIGPLDERYFVYWEDTDWCARAVAHGHELLYVPRAIAFHAVSSSLGLHSPEFLYYFYRNNFLFVRLNTSWPLRGLAYLSVTWRLSKEAGKVFTRHRHKHFRYLRLLAKALTDHAMRRYGQLS